MLQQQTFRSPWKRLEYYLLVKVWQEDTTKLSRSQSTLLHVLRVIMLSFKGFTKDDCALKSSALTFLSALAIVPSIVIAFGISQAFGFDIKREIYALLRGQEAIIDQVFVYAENLLSRTRRGLIAGVGILVLFYTVMRLLYNIESIFNGIWDLKKDRSLQRKFADYTALLLLSPMLVFFSSSLNVFITTHVKTLLLEWEVLGYVSSLISMLISLLPLTLLWCLLGLLYMIMPNTRVQARSALLAAIVAGTVFQITQWLYIKFQVGVSSYNAIYGSLAALPLFLIWMHISWMITLYGAELAFAHQNIRNYAYMHDRPLSLRERKYIALLVMIHISKAFRLGEYSTLDSVSQGISVPRGLVVQALAGLRSAHLVGELLSDKHEHRYQPTIDIHRLTPRLVIDRLETTGFTGISMNHQSREALRLRAMLSDTKQKDDVLLIDM